MKSSIKRLFLCIICLFLLLYIKINVDADADTTPPAVTAIEILQQEVVRPGIVTVRVHFTEEDTGVSAIGVSLCHISNSMAGGDSTSSNTYSGANLDGVTLYTGYADVNIPISTNSLEGTWVITSVGLSDHAGNSIGSMNYRYGGSSEYYNKLKFGTLEMEAPTVTIRDEFDIAFEVSLSNPNLVTRLDGMENGKTARILIDDASHGILKKEAFDAIKGKNKTIVAYNSQGTQWIIVGTRINKATKDIDLTTIISSITTYVDENSEDAVSIQFADNGELPSEVQVRIKSDYLYNLYGIRGRLFLYYMKTSELDEEASDIEVLFDGTNKWCAFTLTHNSSFILSGRRLSFSSLTKDSTSNDENDDKSSSNNTKNTAFDDNIIDTSQKKTNLTKLKAGKKTITVSWKKQTKGISGYQIQYSTDKKFKNKVKTTLINKAKKTSKTIKNLKPGKKYYIRIRTYRNVNGQRVYSKWSKVKKVTTLK